VVILYYANTGNKMPKALADDARAGIHYSISFPTPEHMVYFIMAQLEALDILFYPLGILFYPLGILLYPLGFLLQAPVFLFQAKSILL
jgi:hypothetical protein